MKIEIWSDIMCPFCYIGKRRLEAALKESGLKPEIVWKSFQLNPSMKTDPEKNINEYLAEIKGWPLHRAKELNDHVAALAGKEGLVYDFDHAVVANSFNAHRLIQLAKSNDLGGAAEERLFRAYFTEGENIDDPETLIRLGTDIGLDSNRVREMLAGDEFGQEVTRDVEEAGALGIRGVPFFVINRKYGISGAQPLELFLETLNKAVKE